MTQQEMLMRQWVDKLNLASEALAMEEGEVVRPREREGVV